MLFDRSQRVRCTNRSVLARVARKNEPAIAGLNQPDQLAQLAPADLAGLVHQDDRITRQFPGHEQVCECLRSQAVLLQIVHLLALRCQHNDTPARLPDLIHQFAQDKAFAGSSAAPEQGHGVSRTQQCVQS